jgi:hypothetical protein
LTGRVFYAQVRFFAADVPKLLIENALKNIVLNIKYYLIEILRLK